jgi:hypothetical protein
VENIVITWRELLIIVVVILAVYVAEMLLLMRTGGSLLRKPRWLGMIQEKRSESELRAELEGLKERVMILEKLLHPNAEEEVGEPTPYQRAIQLARQGRDAAVISERCGISRAEAELIVSMHGASG